MEKEKIVQDLDIEIHMLRLKLKNLENELQKAEKVMSEIKGTGDNNTVPVISVVKGNSISSPVPVVSVVKGNSINSPTPDVSVEIPKESNNDNNNIEVETSNNSEVAISVLNETTNLTQHEENNTSTNNGNNRRVNRNKNKNKNKKGTTKTPFNESWIGKNFMGAIASILVFIALITFAMIIIPKLSDGNKIALIFTGSFVMTIVGFILSKKKPENTFYKALLACGSACIYISIMVSTFYFKYIKWGVMYLLIDIWAIVIIFFKKDKNDWLFFTIGNLGYIASIISTYYLKDESICIPVLIYIIMIGLVYEAIHWKNKFFVLIQNIINILSIIIFQFIVTVLISEIRGATIVGIVSIAYGLIGAIVFSGVDYFDYKKIHYVIIVINIIGYLVAFLLLDILLRFSLSNLLTSIVIIIPAIILEINGFYWKIKDKIQIEFIAANTIFSSILFFIAAVILAITDHFIYNSGIILIVYSLFTVYGIFKKDVLNKIRGLILLASLIVVGLFALPLSNVPFTLVATILIISYFIYERAVNNSEPFMIAGYIASLLWIVRLAFLTENNMYYNVFATLLILTSYIYERIINNSEKFKIFSYVSLLLWIVRMSIFPEYNVAFNVVASLFMISASIYERIAKNQEPFRIVSYVAFLLWIVRMSFFPEYNLAFNIVATILILSSYAYERVVKNSKNLKAISYAAFLLWIVRMAFFPEYNLAFNIVATLLIFSSYVYERVINNSKFFKIGSYVALLLWVVRMTIFQEYIVAFNTVATLFIVSSFIYERVVNNSFYYKMASYFALILWIIRIASIVFFTRIYIYRDELTKINASQNITMSPFEQKNEIKKMSYFSTEIIMVVTYGVIAILNMAMILTKFYNTKGNVSAELNNIIHIILDIINLICMFIGGYKMSGLKDNLLKAIYMCIVFILAFINIPIKDKKSSGRYIYTAVKFAILIFYSLYIFEVENLIISSCMIAFAVFCIAIGFKDRAIGKKLRIFGLVMTLVFVLKFILIDIHIDGSIEKAFSYLVSGILCFGISFIYNFFEKKHGKSTEELNDESEEDESEDEESQILDV